MSSYLNAQHVFIVGIKGVAMAGIARILTQMGKKVSGSDTNEDQITDEEISNLKCQISKLTEPLPSEVDLVLYSAAHGGNESAQVKEAHKKGITIANQAAFIAELSKHFSISIAICGSHGKTGTSALVAYVFDQLGVKISWLVGAPYFKGKAESREPRDESLVSVIMMNKQQDTLSMKHQKSNAVSTYPGGHYEKNSSIFVFEADEYGVCPPTDLTPKLLLYYPTHILCTNIDFDHPDVYQDIHHVRKVFHEFFTHTSDVYECNSKSIAENTLGVIGLLRDLGYDPLEIERVIRGFLGVARRMEYHGEHNGVAFVDDYGHHPAEIVVAIREMRRLYPGMRLVVAFQSHTYSRTNALKQQFVEALSQADIILVDVIFPSAREKGNVPVITAYDLETLAKEKGYNNIKGFADRNDLVVYAKAILKKGDVFLTLGAGDIYKIITNFK